jgi:hypothetical protein
MTPLVEGGAIDTLLNLLPFEAFRGDLGDEDD